VSEAPASAGEDLERTLEVWDIGRIQPYENNAWEHPEDQMERLVESIKGFGFVTPVIVTPEGSLIAGHGRLQAVQRLGMSRIPVLIVDGLTEEQVRGYRIADNELHRMGDWNLEALRVELEALEDVDFDMDLLGFDEAELQRVAQDVPTFIGGEFLQDGTPRTNNNLSRINTSTMAAFRFGELNVVLPQSMNDDLLERCGDWPDPRQGVIAVLRAGLENADPDQPVDMSWLED